MNTYPDSLLGYRVWKIRDGKLCSMAVGDSVWQRGLNQAECILGFDHAPAENCECGLYAYHTAEEAQSVVTCVEMTASIAERGLFTQAAKNYTLVSGAVLARGQVQIHRRGLRAEAAAPLALVDERGDSLIQSVAQSYHLPTFKTCDELRAHCESFGITAPESSKPARRPE